MVSDAGGGGGGEDTSMYSSVRSSFISGSRFTGTSTVVGVDTGGGSCGASAAHADAAPLA